MFPTRIGLRTAAFVLMGVSATACGSRSRSEHPCPAAVVARKWDDVATHCKGERWRTRAQLGEAWRAHDAGKPAEALALVAPLLGTDVDADAAYLAGYLRGRDRDDAAERAAGRALLERALGAYRLAGRHGDASRAASVLSRLPRPEHRFEDELEMARLAVTEADLSGDQRMRGAALRTLAEAYDTIGMAGPAREAFLDAEQLLETWPDDLAWAYLNHGLYLLDRGSPDELRTALRFLDAAATEVKRATDAGLGARVARAVTALHLNRAFALSQLDQLAEAEAELAPLAGDDASRSRVLMVRGYVAARKKDLAAATRWFSAAEIDARDGDYGWNAAVEIGALQRATGDPVAAERSFRTAVEIVESLRSDAGDVELRPWVLQRRTRPYSELIDLLVAQGREADALAVAEALHARTWLDVTLGRSAVREPTLDEALRDARVLARAPAGRATTGAELLARLGGQEALVYVTTGDHVWRAHVVGGRVTFARLPAQALDVVGRFRGAPDDVAVATAAAEVLLPPALTASAAPLLVVGRPAADVPFAALRWQGAPLVRSRPVAFLPGLAVDTCAARTWAGPPVVMGDVAGDLQHAGVEAQRVARLHGVTAYTGATATLAVLEQARDARLFHVAVHGRTSSGSTALELRDGTVTAAHILDLGVAPEVVMLTGCNTAAAPDAESWGGFPSAFLANGSRHVISTVRSVEDAAAAALSAAYYDQPEGVDPVHRLAAAQLVLAEHWPASQWASFTAWGAPLCP